MACINHFSVLASLDAKESREMCTDSGLRNRGSRRRIVISPKENPELLKSIGTEENFETSKNPKPSSEKSIIEEALSIHEKLEALLGDKSMDVEVFEIFRSEMKSLETKVEAYSICPDYLIPVRIAAIEARIWKIKGLRPVNLSPKQKEGKVEDLKSGNDSVNDRVSSNDGSEEGDEVETVSRDSEEVGSAVSSDKSARNNNRGDDEDNVKGKGKQGLDEMSLLPPVSSPEGSNVGNEEEDLGDSDIGSCEEGGSLKETKLVNSTATVNKKSDIVAKLAEGDKIAEILEERVVADAGKRTEVNEGYLNEAHQVFDELTDPTLVFVDGADEATEEEEEIGEGEDAVEDRNGGV
ncbi:hypothetical protein U1Q18_003279 [Sarracenia purpurea var. burkii]